MNLHDKVIIPHHWTSEEASSVLRFLYQIADAIWDVHGDGVIELSERPSPTAPREPAVYLDDGLPF